MLVHLFLDTAKVLSHVANRTHKVSTVHVPRAHKLPSPKRVVCPEAVDVGWESALWDFSAVKVGDGVARGDAAFLCRDNDTLLHQFGVEEVVFVCKSLVCSLVAFKVSL